MNIKKHLSYWFFPVLFLIFMTLNLIFIILSYQQYRDSQYHKTLHSLTNTIFQVYLRHNNALESSDQANIHRVPRYISYFFSDKPTFYPVIGLDIPTKYQKNSYFLYTDIRKQIETELGSLPFFHSKDVSICYVDLKQCANFKIELPNLYYLYFLLLLFLIFMLLLIPIHFVYKQKLVQPFLRMQALADKLNLTSGSTVTKPFNFKNLADLMEKTCSKLNTLIDEKMYTIQAISHDLKTPITKAKLYMYNNIPTKYHDELIKYYDDMEYLLAQISVYAKKTYFKEKRQKIDLIDFAESVCHEYQINGFAVSFSTTLQKAIVIFRHKALKRVVQNLIDNAIKYAGSVMVHIEESNQQLYLLFTDSGPGIANAHLTKICDPFYRVDSARSHNIPGSGLGLAIVKEILTHNNAELMIYNNENANGLTVKVAFQMP
ncbi:sensor histidine kinase [Fastidiosibacter lacustris]|uniref:sensor histidine kinase n=1 Tax=Fastidiosibacter lacustris TaxID=2056695 RepID=UPI0013005CD6|nr:HAMP domain-containing sensor histidine kinase [Fastidiosibacter lacustris]